MSGNIKDILKLKENFPYLSSKKIEDIYKTINETGKLKPHINMTTKGPSCKQIIVPMDSENINKFMTFFSEHVANLNHTLKGIRSDIFIYFIHFNYCGLIVISNKVTFSSDLNVVENYIKNINFVDSNNVQSA